jgi:predicted enzyme related to lactoylglutathione lyase
MGGCQTTLQQVTDPSSYQRVHGLSFGPPDPDLGHARVATQADGALVGIRKPLAAHEQPLMRTYVAVDDIHHALKEAEESGAAIADPPTRQGNKGTFAIVIQGDGNTDSGNARPPPPWTRDRRAAVVSPGPVPLDTERTAVHLGERGLCQTARVVSGSVLIGVAV